MMADELGMLPAEIRFLDKRAHNPAEALLSWLEEDPSSTVGNLYNAMVNYDMPTFADLM